MSDSEEVQRAFRARHVGYFKACLAGVPEPYTGLETSRISAIYFAVVALDLLGALHEVDREGIISYVYSLQVSGGAGRSAGFVGSGYLGFPFCDHSRCAAGGRCAHTAAEPDPDNSATALLEGHLAMTYTALVVLKTLGDDLSRVRRADILDAIGELQVPSGCFAATRSGSEADMRFLFCACAVSRLLGDWRAVDTRAAMGFIARCTTYEGGIALTPGAEAHGGSTFCAIAALSLMGQLRDHTEGQSSFQVEEAMRWCLSRQLESGFCGRTNKEPDTCYSFWNGGALQLMSAFALSHPPSTLEFVSECESHFSGGFSKVPLYPPDILHSFYSLCWMALARLNGLKEFDCELGICKDRLSS